MSYPGTLPSMYESYPFVAPEKYAGKLKGKVAIVTGASVGLGRYVAKAYAAAGSSVACVARREADLKSLVEEIKQAGGHAVAIVADVAERGAPKRIVSQAESELGPVDILINNAAISRIGPIELEDEDMDIWWKVQEVNVRAPVALIRAVLPSMLERKTGQVISISSGVASMALPVMTAYASSKAAISKFHELLAVELKDTGVYSYSVTPGLVATELGKPEDALNKAAMEHPMLKAFMGTVGGMKYQQPDVMANVCVALSADERFKALNGRFINADRDIEPVVKETEKEGGGRIVKENLYTITLPQL
ncbi:hypothetical protein LTR56_021845 [Elasticomyces elasticus]|nr:hypothetical protein LTR56_021845 [Elasticomyces elasticus]KAK3641646.1 hypothetical protein LTR22_016464 [Elasticomyces elasticus]KAK4906067.1 hypothetical protein LTR49_024731 [Elasticomyces elasticus]KAK5743720.1 hypothetical protein LTS12_023757 [Elasticomyces elasticus]